MLDDNFFFSRIKRRIARVLRLGGNADPVKEDHTPVALCPFPWSYMMILPDGFVRTCCYNVTRLGNINESSFDEIWNGEKYIALRSALVNGDYESSGCVGCPLYERSGVQIETATQNRLLFSDGTPDQIENARKIHQEMVDKKTTLEGKPVALALELSHACNYDCEFCFQQDKTIGIKIDRLEGIKADCLTSVRELIMTGGDPLAYKENIRLLESFTEEQSEKLFVEFYTNGALLDRHWELLEKFPNVFVVISLHSLDDKTYRRIMKTTTPVKRVVENIDHFLDAGKDRHGWRVSVTNILMKSTVTEAYELAKFAVERDCELSFTYLHGDMEENIYLYPFNMEDESKVLEELDRAISYLSSKGEKYSVAHNNLKHLKEKLFNDPRPSREDYEKWKQDGENETCAYDKCYEMFSQR